MREGMKKGDKAVLLRIYIGELDRYHGKPLWEAILMRSRELGLAGCTVLHGVAGFGAASHLHTSKVLRLSEDLPVLIEIVDRQDKIDEMMPFLEEVVTDGMITTEKVEIVKYVHSGKGKA
jgi:PII-like signaling protein